MDNKLSNIYKEYGETFRLSEISGAGNGLFATRDIEKDELIFKDTALFRTCLPPTTQSCCSYCHIHETNMKHKENIDPETCTHSSLVSCSGNCGMRFCSSKCMEYLNKRGHRWLCHPSTYSQGGIIDLLSHNDPQGHIVLAFTVYATILEEMYQIELKQARVEQNESINTQLPQPPAASSSSSSSSSYSCSSSSTVRTTPIEIFDNLMFSIQREDYCRTTHAFRNGLNEVDEDMFSSLIAPAYYSSYLETPLKLITEYFQNENHLPRQLWKRQFEEGTKGRPEGSNQEHQHQYYVTFLQSELFTDEMFIRRLIGTFVINNLQIEMIMDNDDGDTAASSSSSNGTTVGDGILLGTGLYKLYSKMNHSCLSNIRNEMGCNTATSKNNKTSTHRVDSGGGGGDDDGDDGTFAQVCVYAKRKIIKGEEITNCYLHLNDSTACISKKSRNVMLRQYMFTCTCDLCSQEGGQPPDSESDDDY